VIVTPICPHSFTQKPILIPSEKNISLKITQNNDEKVSVTFD
jgi:NAD kinase